MLQDYSLADALAVAGGMGLRFDVPGGRPSDSSLRLATRALAAALDSGTMPAAAAVVSDALWRGGEQALESSAASLLQAGVNDARLDSLLDEGDRLRGKHGHYLGATFYYAGEWYWGVDRLHYLEQRLGDLGLRRSSPDGGAQGQSLVEPAVVVAPAGSGEGFVLEYFASLRSPYTAIVTPRVFEFAERSGVDLLVRPVLPMVMRGLAVPRAKRMYILRDTAREARRAGVPFGRVSDPLGRPVERALSLHDWARGQGREREYLLAFYDLVWAHGVDAGSDAGLRQIVQRAGLDWSSACAVVDNDDWRGEVEQNRVDMMAAGCWGVPSFRLSGPGLSEPLVTWGQDRLWLIERALTGLS
jgi:2-hydroxychromene-2-carboxylate isomerase